MLKGEALGYLLRALPTEWRKRLSVHLGVPHVEWCLKQLKRFGFNPEYVLDVGAFQGDWARTCLSVYPEATITCVEPQDGLQQKLRDLVAETPNVNVINVLLGRRDVAAVPFREVGSGSSVLASEPESSSFKTMVSIDSLITSSQCKPPHLLKLDVQGYEIEVLEGWRNRFDQCAVIQCEISLIPIVPQAPALHELVDYLFGRGFVMFDVTEFIRSPSDGAVWQIDALFCRSDSPIRRNRSWR